VTSAGFAPVGRLSEISDVADDTVSSVSAAVGADSVAHAVMLRRQSMSSFFMTFFAFPFELGYHAREYAFGQRATPRCAIVPDCTIAVQAPQ